LPGKALKQGALAYVGVPNQGNTTSRLDLNGWTGLAMHASNLPQPDMVCHLG
jgi:hypothetical protein